MFQKCENNFLRTSRNGENILIFLLGSIKFIFIDARIFACDLTEGNEFCAK